MKTSKVGVISLQEAKEILIARRINQYSIKLRELVQGGGTVESIDDMSEAEIIASLRGNQRDVAELAARQSLDRIVVETRSGMVSIFNVDEPTITEKYKIQTSPDVYEQVLLILQTNNIKIAGQDGYAQTRKHWMLNSRVIIVESMNDAARYALLDLGVSIEHLSPQPKEVPDFVNDFLNKDSVKKTLGTVKRVIRESFDDAAVEQVLTRSEKFVRDFLRKIK